MEKRLVRVNKYLSEIGYCSRRAADKLIEQGKLTVNGKVPPIGEKISEEDEIRVDGKIVHSTKKKVYLDRKSVV